MYLLFIRGGMYGFGWGEIHNEGRLKGWALKSRLFWALKRQQAQRVPFGLKKVEIFFFRAHPFKRTEKWISSHPNPYVQPYIKNRYIGNFMDKRFQGPFRDGF
jgi:hypothetical protein